MAIFLQILCTVGFVLLIALAIIAALIALILFLPVVYRVKIKKEENFDGSGCVRWLFGALIFSFEFGTDGLKTSLRVFGIKIGPGKKKDKTVKKDASEEYQPAKKQPTIRPGERVDGESDTKKRDDSISSDKIKTDVDVSPDQIKDEKRSGGNTSGNGIKHVDNEAFTEKAEPTLAEKISFKFNDLCDKLKKAGDIKKIFDKAKPVLIKLVKVIMPKKISGYIELGFDDPANTGILLAIVSALCIPIPEKLRVTPCFEEKKFNCDVKITGRIFVIILLINVIKLLKIPEIRKLIKESRGKDRGSNRKKTKRKNKHKSKNKRRSDYKNKRV